MANNAGENRSEFKLKNGPDDGISAVRFAPTSPQVSKKNPRSAVRMFLNSGPNQNF